MTSEAEKIQNKTSGDLYDFVQAAAWKGIITESLSSHLRAAIKKIFLATAKSGEFWRDLPLVLDISERIAKLRAVNSGECSEKTIEAYRRRYDRSLRLYMEHAGDSSASAPADAEPPAPPVRPSAAPSAPFIATPATLPAPDAQTLALQKVLAASIKFQQEVLEAMSLITEKKGGPPSMLA